MQSQTFSIPAYSKFLLKENACRAYFALILIATVSIFVFDLNVPLGIAAGTPYVLVVFGSLWTKGNMSTYIISILGLLFIFLGFYLSPTNTTSIEAAIVNRSLAALLLVVTAIMVLKIKQANADISALMTQTTTDPLTQCKNRRAFEQDLSSEILRDKRYGRNLSVAIIDIDHLKSVNATYGYDSGDDLIKRIKGIVINNIRNSDALYRLEGDQFAILFTETDITEARQVGRIICQNIATTFRKNKQNTTVSIGIASLNMMDSKRKLCKRAEDALLTSKNNGKNQVSTLPHIVTSKTRPPIPAILSRSRLS